jgi:hypothetical protein
VSDMIRNRASTSWLLARMPEPTNMLARRCVDESATIESRTVLQLTMHAAGSAAPQRWCGDEPNNCWLTDEPNVEAFSSRFPLAAAGR